MKMTPVSKCFLYLVMVSLIGASVFCLSAGICCTRLEDFRRQDGNRELALESLARAHAGEIMNVYFSQGMEQVNAYAKDENVNYIIQKASGRRVGGNYRTEKREQILILEGRTLEYTFWFPEEGQEEPSGYLVRIAYLHADQIHNVYIDLEGLPHDLRVWAGGFYVSALVALVLAGGILRSFTITVGHGSENRRGQGNRRAGKPWKVLLLWGSMAAALWLWERRLPQIWEIPINWEEGSEPVKALLGQSIRDSTFCGFLWGILATGFVLHLIQYRRFGQRGLIMKVCRKPGEAMGQLSWPQKAVLILMLVCGLEAALLGVAQYRVMQGKELGVLREWMITKGGAFLVWGLWILEKTILAPLVLRTARGMERLRTSGRELAKGNLGYQISLEGMKGEALQFGRDLNAISQVVADAVEDRMKSEHLKTELITNVSHDIKTPLTSIINYADLIGREPSDNEKIAEYAGVLHRQSTRLKKLIEDLMEVSKAATGNLEVHLERCQAGVLLSQAMGEFEQRLQEREIDLIIRQCQEPVWIMADTRMLWRILDNLMTNICKYAQSGTRVYLSLETQEGQAVLVFKNISSQPLEMDAEELMERFVRGDKSRHTEGSGLGLAIARSLTELQGGSMQLTTDGDLFKVTLVFPVAQEDLDRLEIAEQANLQACND
ncbi:MAG: HAMP domain-containing histidine kinase [Lachnospiraceae bacterium]|nr:HAMP domain-containing histidine kinase [Lachnospiraceae bacterium]